MKNAGKLIIGVCILLLTTSCSIGNSRVDMLNKNNDSEKVEEILLKTFEYIEEENYKGMKNLFSKQAQSEVKDFDSDIKYLFDFFEGDVLEWESDGSSTSERIKSGKRVRIIYKYFTIETTENRYVLFIGYYPEDEVNPDNEGVYSMRMVLEENEETEMTYTDEMMIPGIYNPTKSDAKVIE